MYDLPYFKESDQGTVLDFIRQHPFAMLIGAGESGPVATQVPILIDEREGEALFLRGTSCEIRIITKGSSERAKRFASSPGRIPT